MNEACAMGGTLPMLSEQDRPELRREPRRSVRKGVALRMIVEDKAILVSEQVIDMTTRGGGGLRLTKPLTRGQYLTLKVYPNDGTASVQCDVAQVQWVEVDWAGVVFLWNVAGARSSTAAILRRSACLGARGLDAHGTLPLRVH
jgi:hypothetical protein